MTEQPIHDLVGQAERHQNDVDDLLALHTPDAIIVNIAGRRVIGRDAFGHAMRQALGSSLAQVRTRIEVEDIQWVTPDVAIVSCVKHVYDEREDAGGLPAEGALTYVVRRSGDEWRIALAQTTPR